MGRGQAKVTNEVRHGRAKGGCQQIIIEFWESEGHRRERMTHNVKGNKKTKIQSLLT